MDTQERLVPPALDVAAAWAWRLVIVGIAGLGLLELVVRVPLLVFPLGAALLLTVALSPVANALVQRGVGRLVATWLTFGGFLVAFGVVVSLLVPAVADEFDDVGTTVEQGLDDVETWLVEDSPFDVSRQDLEELRTQAGDAVSDFARDNSGRLVSGAILVLEGVAGVVLALVATFFFLKDGDDIAAAANRAVPLRHRERVGRAARRAWWTLGGYLRGSAVLGLVEGVIIAVTITLVGGHLAVPMGTITFLAAFVPFVGAIVAGLVAVLVTLVTAGTDGAVIVALVALAVQQFDNDLLAPLVFGKALNLHPLVIIVAITGFGQLAGLAGAFVAVPITAVTVNVITELMRGPDDPHAATPSPDATGPGPEPGSHGTVDQDPAVRPAGS